jgi:hypothetical protein
MERDAADTSARRLCHVTSGPETVLKFGKVQCRYSSSGVGPPRATIADLACIVKIHRHIVPIDMLLDDVLLDIFDFCLRDPTGLPASNWQTPVHVCQTWRRTIFASPRRLDLCLKCTSGTPVRTHLPFWPVTLPIIVDYRLSSERHDLDEDNLIAVLGHPSRIHRITIHGSGPLIRKVATIMRESFPALTHLDIEWNYEWGLAFFPVIRPGFLGKSPVRLQHLRLSYVSFPRLPTFLFSARNLVTIKLEEIVVPPKGYLSPEAMVRSLTVLTRLTTLFISFNEYQASFSDKWRIHPDSFMRSALPALANFHYNGRSEYLEHFLARIDAPLLDNVTIEYVSHNIKVPQLSRFIGRTENLKLSQFTRGELNLLPKGSYFTSILHRGNAISL